MWKGGPSGIGQEMTPSLVTNPEPAAAVGSGSWCASREWVTTSVKMILAFLLERKWGHLTQSGYRKRIGVDPGGASGWLYHTLFCTNQTAWPCLFHLIPATCPLHTHTEQHQQWLMVSCGRGPSKSCCHHSPGNREHHPPSRQWRASAMPASNWGLCFPSNCLERPPNTTWHLRCLSVYSGLTIRSSGKEASCSVSYFPFLPMNGLLLDSVLYINILKTPCETRLTLLGCCGKLYWCIYSIRFS